MINAETPQGTASSLEKSVDIVTRRQVANQVIWASSFEIILTSSIASYLGGVA